MKKFYVEIRETGDVLEECATYEEARAIVREYQEEDRSNVYLDKNYYAIFERDPGGDGWDAVFHGYF